MEKKTLWYSIQQWRRERTLANESGHVQPPSIDSIPQDQEITLWQQEDFMDISDRSPELERPQDA
jgi:hypothetical protein